MNFQVDLDLIKYIKEKYIYPLFEFSDVRGGKLIPLSF